MASLAFGGVLNRSLTEGERKREKKKIKKIFLGGGGERQKSLEGITLDCGCIQMSSKTEGKRKGKSRNKSGRIKERTSNSCQYVTTRNFLWTVAAGLTSLLRQQCLT